MATVMLEKDNTRPTRVWFVLGIPPLLFLAAIVAASVYVGVMTQGDATAIAEQVSNATAYIVLAVQLLLLGLLVWTMRAEGLTLRALGWRLEPGQTAWREIALGGMVGVPLGLAYIFVLSPFLSQLQRIVGDYVPPGELLNSLGTAALPFFVANVVLAPFVEETLYRGYGILRLRERFGTRTAIVSSCIFFGLLHWAGGFWYIVLTGTVAGGILAGLLLWRKNIVAAFVAHLTLNVVEFVLVGQMR